MRCPECHAANEAEAAACTSCGLLLLNIQPKRRSEDLAVQGRRASDREESSCRFCGGAVAPTAFRCRHCSEVLDDEFFRARAQRIRSRINYTSWVLYLFGLAALLVYRPVGMISIAGGLLLSIAYYAVPVEPSSPAGRKRGFGTMLRRQLAFERVSVGLPFLQKHKLVFVGTPLVAAVIGYGANVLLLQQPVDDILKNNAAFQGMEVKAHYKYWVVPGVVVYDLRSLSFRQTPIDVHTAFLEFAGKLKEKRYSRVDLSFKGDPKFTIDGASFSRLGQEYTAKNFDYVLYSFPKLFDPADGGTPVGTGSERDALLEFHRRWYGQDQLTHSAQSLVK